MRSILASLTLLLALAANAQQSYWWSQELKKPDAKTSQEFFFVPGTGMTFTYATNRVILNSTGGGGTNNYYTNNFFYTNSYYFTNLFTTNLFYTNDFFFTNTFITNTYQTNYVTTNNYYTNYTVGLSITQNVVLWSGTVSNQFTFTNVYANGLLVASGQFIPAHGPSWIWPGGGYILWPNGSTILLP